MHRAQTSLPTRDRDDWQTIRSLVPFLWDYRYRAGFALLVLTLSKVANVGIPLILKEIVDALDQSKVGPEIIVPTMLLLSYGALRMMSSLFNELRDAIFARVRHGSMRKVALKSMHHLHVLSLRYHLERKTGAISRDIERGTRSVSSLLNYMVFSILPTFIEIALVAGVLLAVYDPWFAVITVISVVIYGFFTLKVTEWRMKFRVAMNQADSKANTQAVDSLLNYETVKYFGNESFEWNRYDKSLTEWENQAVLSQTSMSALNFGQASIIAIGVTTIMFLATQGVVDGSLTLGDLVAVNAFLLQLFMPLGFLGVVYSQLKHALSDLDQMFNLLEEKPEINDRADAKNLKIDAGNVRFENTHFHYDPERPILKGIDIDIPAGQKVAVVGASGAGKSTLARLLFRFYDVTQGRILIDGQDLREVTQQSLRSEIGIVPQDTVLFNDTIYYNIAYATISTLWLSKSFIKPSSPGL